MTVSCRVILLAFGVLLSAMACGQVPGPTAAVSQTDAGQTDLRQAAEAAMAEAIGKGEFDRAQKILQGARTRGLSLGLYHLLAAKLCAAQRDHSGEEEHLKGAIYREPELTEAHLRLAAIMERRGLWLDAAELYTRALEVDRELAEAYLELARIFREHDRHRTALETLERGKRALPGDTRILMALGGVYREVGDREAALAQYETAAGLAEGSRRLECLVHVGDLNLEGGHLPAAFVAYQTAAREGLEPTGAEYGRIAGTTDALAWETLQSAWATLEAYLAQKPMMPEREEVYVAVSRGLSQMREFMAVMDSLRPPADLAGRHSQRKFHYSLLCEALTNGLSYLDTGDRHMIEAGRARCEDAAMTRTALSGPS